MSGSGKTVLLLSPPSRVFNHYRPPLALMYLSGYLKKNGISARVVDFTQSHQIRGREFYANQDRYLQAVEDETVARVKAADCDIVGITCYTPELDEVERLAKRVKDARPDVRIVAGGIHPTLYPEQLLGPDSLFDVAVVGEGELTLLEVVMAIRSGASLAEVRGIGFYDRAAGKAVVNPPRPVAEKLDDIIFPDYDDLDMEYYTTASPYSIRGVFVRSFYVTASRGCPSSCTFCVSKKLRNYHGARAFTRLRGPGVLADEVMDLRNRFGTDGFYFIDDLFTLRKENVVEFCRILTERKCRMIWACSSKVNTVDRDMLKTMRDAGCVQIDFGVEKGSDAALAAVRKGTTVEQIRITFKDCRDLGIRTFANILINTPGETEKDLDDILCLLDDIDPTVVSINTFTPYPGCEIYDGMPAGIERKDYRLLMDDPNKLAEEMPAKFRFATHNVDMGKWSRSGMKKYNKVGPNLAIYADARYFGCIVHSKRKLNYLKQLVALGREFANQKFG